MQWAKIGSVQCTLHASLNVDWFVVLGEHSMHIMYQFLQQQKNLPTVLQILSNNGIHQVIIPRSWTITMSSVFKNCLNVYFHYTMKSRTVLHIKILSSSLPYLQLSQKPVPFLLLTGNGTSLALI